MSRSYLGEFEELVLLTVAVMAKGAYGTIIASELKERTNRAISLSGVHIALYRLEEKGLLISELGGATAARGGRSKRMYSITSAGIQILAEVREIRNQYWESISLTSFS